MIKLTPKDKAFSLLSKKTRLLAVLNEHASAHQQALDCIRYNNTDLLKYYLERGVDPNSANSYTQTAFLSLLLDFANYKMVHSLFRYGANPNHQNNSGDSAMHELLERYNKYCDSKELLPTEIYNENVNNLEIAIRFFIIAKADFSLINKSGKTAIDLLDSDAKKNRVQEILNEKPATRLCVLSKAMDCVPEPSLLAFSQAEEKPESDLSCKLGDHYDETMRLDILSCAQNAIMPKPEYISVDSISIPEIKLTADERKQYDKYMAGDFDGLIKDINKQRPFSPREGLFSKASNRTRYAQAEAKFHSMKSGDADSIKYSQSTDFKK